MNPLLDSTLGSVSDSKEPPDANQAAHLYCVRLEPTPAVKTPGKDGCAMSFEPRLGGLNGGVIPVYRPRLFTQHRRIGAYVICTALVKFQRHP